MTLANLLNKDSLNALKGVRVAAIMNPKSVSHPKQLNQK